MVVPLNAADMAAASRDGKLGFMEEILIGDDLLVSALTGLYRFDSQITTRKPTQAGFAIEDASVTQPVDISFDIVLTNPDYSIEGLIGAGISGDVNRLTQTWRDKRDELYLLFNLKEVLTIQTHDFRQPRMKIESITPAYDSDNLWDCWIGTVNFVEVRTTAEEASGGAFDQAQQGIGGL